MLTFKIPIKTISEANTHEHWLKASNRHKMQKNGVKACLNARMNEIRLPCSIKIIRIAPGTLDKADNLPMSLKWITDAVCEIIKPGFKVGKADDDKGFHISFDQRKGEVKEYAVEIEINNI